MLSKQVIKSHQVIKVTFEAPKVELPEGMKINSMHLVGDFNDWDETATPFSYNKKAQAYRVAVELESDRQYQFRYLINGEHWCNDWAADGYAPNDFGEDNCVILTPSL